MKERDEDFYVGYLPTPKRHRAFLRAFVPLTLWAFVAVAALFLKSFRPAGEGVWETGQLQEWRGVVRFSPYPTLVVDMQDGKLFEWLLVESGKVAADQRAEFFEDKYTIVRGFELRRGGRYMIEIMPGHEGMIAPVDGEEIGEVPVKVTGRTTVVGEILDSKCFLGAMKPGDGLTHQACARLCIDGGIPPMLVVHESARTRNYFLLTDAEGGRANEMVRDYVGVPVEVTGEVSIRGYTNAFALESIRRVDKDDA